MHDHEYETLLRGIASITWRASTEGEFYDVDCWCRFTGQTRAEARGLGWLDAVHPDDRASVVELWDAARSTESVYRTEHRVRQADGPYHWFEIWAVPLRDEAEAVVGWFGAGIDNQERVAAVERLRSVMDNISDAFIAIDSEFRIQFQNREGARINGKPPEEIYGKRLWEEWPAMRGTLERHYREAMAEGRTVRLEHRYYDPGKYDVWLDIQAVPSDDGGLGIFYLDITERKRAQQALEASERRFRQFAENVRAALLISSDQGRRIEYASPFVETLWGHTEDALRARPELLLERVHPDDLQAVREQLEQQESQQRRVDHRLVTEQGAVRWVAHSLSPLPIDGEQPARTAHVVLDVTDRKRLEQQLAHAHRLESLGHLAGGVAHDFNNILTVILGRVALLRLRAEQSGDAELARELDEIDAASRRASSITAQVLTFARREPGAPSVIDINQQIQRSATLFRGLVGEGVEITALLRDGAGTVLIDPAQLDQVLVNLVANAAEAMGNHGKLTVSTELHRIEGEDEVELSPGDYVCLSICDDGCGIAPGTLEHVFDPFFTTRADAGGTGLGLATCYGIVTQAGGRISIRSDPGRGTDVRVWLPMAGNAAVAPLDEEHSPSLRGSESILIAEDEAGLRTLLVDVLSALGYRVRSAESGPEALAALRESGPLQLLVTDMVMPGMSGKQLAEAAWEERPGLPVLTISGYRRDHPLPDGPLPAGLAFLPKPFTPRELAHRVREILDAVGRREREGEAHGRLERR